jgi:hypothetical protein
MKTINPPASLNGSHLRTFEKIFAHPATHNLPWRDVFSLFTHLGAELTESKTNFHITLKGHVLVLPSPRTKEVSDVDDLVKLRHFLELSESPAPIPFHAVDHLLVIIDQHRARLFSTEMEGESPKVILPYEPEEYFRHPHDSRDFFSGKEKASPGTYFEPVAKALKNARKVLLFGTGTGNANEMEQFTAWLKKHHAHLASRIIATQTIDITHLTEAQLLAKAREFYAKPHLT